MALSSSYAKASAYRAQRTTALKVWSAASSLMKSSNSSYETALARGMRRTLVQNPANMGRQRYVIQQMAQENPLAFIEVGLGERQSVLGELQVASLQLGEAQHLQGFRHREQLVDLHLKVRGDFRQIGGPVEGSRRHRLHQTASRLDDTCGSWLPIPKPGKRSCRPGRRRSDAPSFPHRCAPPVRGSSGRGGCAAAAASL